MVHLWETGHELAVLYQDQNPVHTALGKINGQRKTRGVFVRSV